MKNLKTKFVLALAVLGMAGGVVLPASQVEASTPSDISTRAYVGMAPTWREVCHYNDGRTIEYYGGYVEIRVQNGYDLVVKNYYTYYGNYCLVEHWDYNFRKY